MHSAHIQIVGWNHRPYLEACITSCMEQSVKVPVLYIDNGSRDGSAVFVEETFPNVRVVEHTENRGYSGGHNDGLKAMPDSQVVIVLNPDVVLDKNFVQECLKGFDDVRVGAVVPLLLRPGSENVVDAFGVRLLRSLRGVNQGEGKPEEAFTSDPWGFTGAAAALRREAIEDVAFEGEVFDEDLFAYREDVDLSWRLRNRGWNIVGAAKACATHVRAVQKGKKKSKRIAQLSWRNYYLVILKNASMRVVLKNIPFVFVEDVLRDIQLLVTPSLWPAAKELFQLLPRFAKKRKTSLGG